MYRLATETTSRTFASTMRRRDDMTRRVSVHDLGQERVVFGPA